jgi:hypothetical protein
MSVNPEITKLLATPELPELGPGPRKGVQLEAALEAVLGRVFRQTDLPKERQQLVRALVLLWHDHLEAAHTIAQSIEDADGAFVHGIMHRREPDYSNAAYWFRRVGRHAAFPEIAGRATDLLSGQGEQELRERLLRGGTWEPFGFIEVCEEAARAGHLETRRQLLREIQRLETEALLHSFCS